MKTRAGSGYLAGLTQWRRSSLIYHPTGSGVLYRRQHKNAKPKCAECDDCQEKLPTQNKPKMRNSKNHWHLDY